jgi:SAM-dependent methyltransferase
MTGSISSNPFMNDFEISAIENLLVFFSSPVKGFEWGSGSSTLFLMKHSPDMSIWNSVEHNHDWYQKVINSLKDTTGVTVHYVPSNLRYVEGGVDDGNYDTFKDYIHQVDKIGCKFDFMLVDGRARVECMKYGWRFIDNSGIMILHDAQRKQYDIGMPADCYFLRITDSERESEGKVSILFMSREFEMLQKLYEVMLKEAYQSLVYQYNFEDSALIDTTIMIEDANNQKHNCVFLNTYYPAFIDNVYRNNRELELLDYKTQLKTLQRTLFGDSDFYSKNIKKAGWEADDLIVNCGTLQKKWTSENGCFAEGLNIAIEQLKEKQPDVVYIQDMHLISREFICAIKPFARLIVGQIASPPGEGIPFDLYDVIISSFPHFVKLFRKYGITSYYQPLAFSPEITQRIPNVPYVMRPIECSFVGGISTHHGKAYSLLELLAKQTPIQFWGYGAQSLPVDSPVLPKHRGEAWGESMFYLMASSKITINRHIDAAENFANNMRLFEATGCGALLITDYKDNLHELFEIGKEVVVYRSFEECAALVNYYLNNPSEAAAIAKAGQARTLRDHTYEKRMSQTGEFLARHLRNKSEKGRFECVDLSRINNGHTSIAREQITPDMVTAWQDESIPSKQRALVQRQLSMMYQGEVEVPFQVLANTLEDIVVDDGAILEIGCASGYYYEVLEYLLNRCLRYTGVDYSEPLIRMAKDYYPMADFQVADGARLPYASKSFPIVISSCVLLHVPNYQEHILETTRVADKYIVAHRTPICRIGETSYLKKFAYGVETVELVFNERELLALFAVHGFVLLQTMEYSSNQLSDRYEATYLFRRK